MSPGLVIDSSALVALFENEAEAPRIEAALIEAEATYLSAFSLLETSLVATSRRGHAGPVVVDQLVRELGSTVVPLSPSQVEFARRAWATFGKGRHPAALNIGDCCSYALAEELGLPLLMKGADFPKTDLPLVDW